MWNNSCYNSFFIVPVEWRFWLKLIHLKTYYLVKSADWFLYMSITLVWHSLKTIYHKNMTPFAICYHLYSFKNMRNNPWRSVTFSRKVYIFGVFLVCIFPHSDWIWTRKNPNMDTFHAVYLAEFMWLTKERFKSKKT